MTEKINANAGKKSMTKISNCTRSSPCERNELNFCTWGFHHQPNNSRGWWVKFEKKSSFWTTLGYSLYSSKMENWFYPAVPWIFRIFVHHYCKLQRRQHQSWSSRGRFWPRGHILKSLASKPQVLKNCPVLGSSTALFFEPLKFCRKTPKPSRKSCEDLFCFPLLEIAWSFFDYFFENTCACVLGLGFFCVLEPYVLDSTDPWCTPTFTQHFSDNPYVHLRSFMRNNDSYHQCSL